MPVKGSKMLPCALIPVVSLSQWAAVTNWASHGRHIENLERIWLFLVTTQSTCTVTVQRPTVF